MRIIFVLCLAFGLLFSSAQKIESIKVLLQSSDEIDVFRGYNESKSLYLKALMQKDNNLARESLVCIVSGGKKLGIDVSKYESDLQKLNSTTDIKEAVAEKNTLKGEPIPTVVYDKTIKPSELFVAPQPSSTITQSSSAITQSEAVSIAPRNKLINFNWKNGGLELLFDEALKSSQLKISKILEPNQNRFRYIVDIDLALLSKSYTIEHKDISRIKIAQYDSKTVRVVFENNTPLKFDTNIKDKTLFVSLSIDTTTQVQPKVEAPKTTTMPPLADLPPLVVSSAKTQTKKVVVIDPGHGGKDSGAVGNGYMEKNIVLAIAKKLSDRLNNKGYTVYMTRSDDRFIELKDRTKFANDKNADLFISVHANAIPKTSDPNKAQGIETYFLSPTRSERSMRVAALENSEDMSEMGQYGKLSFLSFLNKEKIIASNKLAIDLQRGMVNTARKGFSGVVDNGVREGPFWVLVGAQMPAVLLEVGYITHPGESARIADDSYQDYLVDGLTDGVGRYFANN